MAAGAAFFSAEESVRLLVAASEEPLQRLFLALVQERLSRHWSATLVLDRLPRAPGRPNEAGDRESRKRSATGAGRLRGRLASLVGRALGPWGADLVAHQSLPDILERVKAPPAAPTAALFPGMVPFPIENAPGIRHAVDPDAEDVLRWLADESPDLIVAFGEDRLTGPWAALPPLGLLGCRLGLLPYIGTADPIAYALFQDHADRVGATVFYADDGAGVRVVREDKIGPTPAASLQQLAAQVTLLGMRALVDCAARSLEAGARLPAVATAAKDRGLRVSADGSFVGKVAQWRLNELRRSWPGLQARVEKQLSLAIRTRGASPYPSGVYMFLYHSIVGEGAAEWEVLYDKAALPAARFRDHLAHLASAMTPLSLSEAPGVLSAGRLDRPYFVVTFDDGYRNVLTEAAPAASAHGLRPALFVNSAFVEGRVYYRVLAAVLCAKGHARLLADTLRRSAPDIPWSDDPKRLFAETKNHFRPGVTQKAVEETFEVAEGDPSALRVHLDGGGTLALAAQGWEIGNHTTSHEVLADLTYAEVDTAIAGNASRLAGLGIPLANWLAYPNGHARHVNEAVGAWMDGHPDVRGLFAAGGVNLLPTRKDWLRIPVGDWSVDRLKLEIERNVLATKRALLS